MAKRKIIKIDTEKCTGCGLCIPNCPEGAIQVIDGKARLISDLFCDGLGACIGYCPEGAITIEEREAQGYDERKAMKNIVRQGENVIRAHLGHLEEHRQTEFLKQAVSFLKERKIEVPSYAFSTCPHSNVMDLRSKDEAKLKQKEAGVPDSQLKNWPVQLMLVSPFAPYLNRADVLIAADCVAFAYADFQQDLLKDKVLLVGCPKLDDTSVYREKIIQILQNNRVKSITYAHMEVPCCFGLVNIIKEAIANSGKDIPFKEVIISIKGERLS